MNEVWILYKQVNNIGLRDFLRVPAIRRGGLHYGEFVYRDLPSLICLGDTFCHSVIVFLGHMLRHQCDLTHTGPYHSLQIHAAISRLYTTCI